METIEIAPGKKKLIRTALGSLLFVLLGLWLLIFQPTIGNPVFDNAVVKYGVAIAAIIFFGFTLFYAVKKLGSKAPSLVINEEGILDNASATNVGQIAWSDITGIELVKVFKQEFLIITVSNPGLYINRQTNMLKRKALQYNFNNYGSPVAIPSAGLDYNLEELKNIIADNWAKAQAQPSA
jgi:hypothetical protein